MAARSEAGAMRPWRSDRCRAVVTAAVVATVLMQGAPGASVAQAAQPAPGARRVVVALDGSNGVVTIAPPGGGPAPIDHLDAYTAPRLAGYTDPNPCTPPVDFELRVAPPPAARNGAVVASAAVERGATPAPGSGGEAKTLALRGARVELAAETPARELVIFVLTRTGRAQVVGRESVPVASGAVLPLFVKDDFGRFYAAATANMLARTEPGAALVEYTGDLGFCDPCVADPLPIAELHQLGATWAADPPPKANPMQSAAAPQDHQGGARNVFVTRFRLALGASEHTWPPLELRETPDRRDFQVRFVVRRPYTAGPIACAEGETYRARLARQHQSAVDALAGLTGWPRAEIEQRAGP